MKVVHYGEDYCKVVIGDRELELPIAVGKGIERFEKSEKEWRIMNAGNLKEISELKDKLHRRNMQIKELKEEVKRLQRLNPNLLTRDW